MHCLSSIALCIQDLFWIFTEYSLQPYFWKGTWHLVPRSPLNEHFISESALKCYNAGLVFVRVCIKHAQSQTVKNSTLKQRTVSIWIALRAYLSFKDYHEHLFQWFFPGSWCSLHLCFPAESQSPSVRVAQKQVTGGAQLFPVTQEYTALVKLLNTRLNDPS